MLNNLRLAFLLHFYQPWWQYDVVLEKIVNQCYRPILKLVREHAHVPILQIGHQIDPDFDQIVDEEWVTSMVMRMEKDGLLVRKKSVISLA